MPDEIEPSGAYIKVSVAELLKTINEKLDKVDAKLDEKVSKAEYQLVLGDVATLKAKVAAMELTQQHMTDFEHNRKVTKERIWSVALGIALVLVTLLSVLGVHL